GSVRSCCEGVTTFAVAGSLFFFSSRRRHTRLVSDWSSDVCSSDLVEISLPPMPCVRMGSARMSDTGMRGSSDAIGSWKTMFTSRSEERRVGKECKDRWAPEHEKKKVGGVGEGAEGSGGGRGGEIRK